MSEFREDDPFWATGYSYTTEQPKANTRLIELAKADSEGRVIVLPCNVGDDSLGAKAYGKILNDICNYHNCDKCPMSDQFGVCRPKQSWPRITEECIAIVLEYVKGKKNEENKHQ